MNFQTILMPKVKLSKLLSQKSWSLDPWNPSYLEYALAKKETAKADSSLSCKEDICNLQKILLIRITTFVKTGKLLINE